MQMCMNDDANDGGCDVEGSQMQSSQTLIRGLPWLFALIFCGHAHNDFMTTTLSGLAVWGGDDELASIDVFFLSFFLLFLY